MPPPTWDRKNLLGLEGLSPADLTDLLDLSEQFRQVASGKAPRLNLLADRTVGNLFFEDSTRTRCSFTMAARRLGAETIDLNAFGSSVKKGETIVDTALNLQAMGVHAFVVRAAASGEPQRIAHAVDVPVINAGDGSHEHPTQGLLDLLTLRRKLGDLKNKTIGIVGDIANSRVARSNIHALTTMGANVVLIGPPTMAPKAFEKIVPSGALAGAAHTTAVAAVSAGPSTAAPSVTTIGAIGQVRVQHDLDIALPLLDAIMMLRVQFERTGGGPPLISGDYRQLYGLTMARAAMLPPHAIIMHPGPMNRGLEIDSEVADDPVRSVIPQQVANGVAIRMAVLARLLEN